MVDLLRAPIAKSSRGGSYTPLLAGASPAGAPVRMTPYEELRELVRSYGRPRQPRLDEARAVVRGHIHPRAAWEALATRGLIPDDWVGSEARAFTLPTTYFARTRALPMLDTGELRRVTFRGGSVLVAAYPTTSTLAAFVAADAEGIATAEAIARESLRKGKVWLDDLRFAPPARAGAWGDLDAPDERLHAAAPAVVWRPEWRWRRSEPPWITACFRVFSRGLNEAQTRSSLKDEHRRAVGALGVLLERLTSVCVEDVPPRWRVLARSGRSPRFARPEDPRYTRVLAWMRSHVVWRYTLQLFRDDPAARAIARELGAPPFETWIDALDAYHALLRTGYDHAYHQGSTLFLRLPD